MSLELQAKRCALNTSTRNHRGQYVPRHVMDTIKAVCAEHRIPLDRVLCPADQPGATFKEVAECRMAAMRAVMATEPRPSWAAAGRWFDRHHTTVMNACGVLKS